MGDDTAHWAVFGRILPQGGSQDDGKTTLERTGRWMGVSPTRGRDGGGGIIGGVDLRLPLTEHSHTVHCNQDHYGPVSGGGAEAGDKGGQLVVGEGRLGLGGDADCGSGGGMDGGGGGDRRDGTETEMD